MPELSLAPAPPRDELLRQIRARLADAAPGMRLVAQGVLGEGARIDFVGVDPDGAATLVLVGEAGEDLSLVARALAQRVWLEPRLRDWLQLAPNLGFRPEAGVRLVLLCPAFGTESQAAARGLGEAAPQLVTYRCVRNGSGVEPLLEPLGGAPSAVSNAPEMPHDERSNLPPPPEGPTGTLPSFRTGLTDADLEVTLEERREFE